MQKKGQQNVLRDLLGSPKQFCIHVRGLSVQVGRQKAVSIVEYVEIRSAGGILL